MKYEMIMMVYNFNYDNIHSGTSIIYKGLWSNVQTLIKNIVKNVLNKIAP